MSPNIMPSRAKASPMQGLLSKQLASITSTLANASRRRDNEIQKRATSAPTTASSTPALKPLVACPFSPSPNESAMSGIGTSPADVKRSQKVRNGCIEDVHIKDSQMRESKDVLPPPPRVSLRGDEASEIEDPTRMLADFEMDLDLPTKSVEQSEEDDLEFLRNKLTTMLSPPREDTVRNSDNNVTPPHSDPTRQSEQAETGHKPENELDREVIPYAVALQLQRFEINWDKASAWTEYLFSEGPNGYKAVAEKDALIERALLNLNTVIKQTLDEEALYLAAEEKASAPCRIIVTNLAADADEEELALFFHEFKYEIRKLRLLEKRDPVKRTQTAYIDMYNRAAAKQATYTIGSIYGLMVNVRLAEEVEAGEHIVSYGVDVSDEPE